MGTQKKRLNESALKSTQNKNKTVKKIFTNLHQQCLFVYRESHMKIFSNYSKDWFSEDGVEMIFKHTLITNTLQDQALNWYKSQH